MRRIRFVGRDGARSFCSASQSLATALDQLLLQFLHPFSILLVPLLAQLADALDKLGRIQVVGHDGLGESVLGDKEGRAAGAKGRAEAARQGQNANPGLVVALPKAGRLEKVEKEMGGGYFPAWLPHSLVMVGALRARFQESEEMCFRCGVSVSVCVLVCVRVCVCGRVCPEAWRRPEREVQANGGAANERHGMEDGVGGGVER